MLKPLLAVATALALTATAAHADEAVAGPDLTRLSAVLDGRKPDAVNSTPIPGLYEVVLGARVIYVSADGRYAIRGDIVDIVQGDNLTEARSGQLRVQAIAAVPELARVLAVIPGGRGMGEAQANQPRLGDPLRMMPKDAAIVRPAQRQCCDAAFTRSRN